MAHLAKGLRFNLTNALARDAELPPNFLERSAVAVHQTEALLEHLTLAFGQSLQHVANLAFEDDRGRHVRRILRALVLDEVAEARVLAVADRGLQRNGLL